MFLSIMSLPLYGSVVSGFFGRKVGVSGAQLITISGVIITTLVAIITFFEVGFNNITLSINLFRWIDSEWFGIFWAFQYDSLTVSMLIPVLIISSLVHLYSVGYMNGDPHNQRFFSYLSLFTFMMIILVTANNYLLMFVGWEGVGVCSYLLVSFWFTRIAANQSSMSAFLTNRVGDCFLTIGMFGVLWSLGNLDYGIVFSLAPYINETIITFIGICMLIGAMAKSSQVGLHVWLPMAMEGPTPVSALIHAATMVTAGVYLLMRSSPWIEYSSTVLLLCLWLGAITTVFSSLIGLFQQDIKKVIAYSTMSQLGMMVIAVGLSSYNVALFHLINHAFYKGLLFLGAGAVIHAVADNQDFRRYGGLISFLPLTYSVILIASLSLVAFPFMTGFYSKDFILESAFGQFYFSGIAVYVIATIGAIFTTLYSVKVLYLTFIANPNGPAESYKHAHESDLFISLPLMILAIFSIFFGFITKDIFIGLGSNFFIDNSIFIHPTHEIMIDTEFAVPTFFKILPFIFTISFSALAIIIPEFLPELVTNFKLSILGYNIFGFFNQRFLVELFYNKYITNSVLELGGQTTKVLDKGSIEMGGPYGIQRILMKLSKSITNLNTGIVTNYALFIFIGLNMYIFTPSIIELGINFIFLALLSLLILCSINLISSSYNNNDNTLEASVRLFSTSSRRMINGTNTTRPSTPVEVVKRIPARLSDWRIYSPKYTPNFEYLNMRIPRPIYPNTPIDAQPVPVPGHPGYYIYPNQLPNWMGRSIDPLWARTSPHQKFLYRSKNGNPGQYLASLNYDPTKPASATNVPDMSKMPGISGIPGHWSRNFNTKPWDSHFWPRPDPSLGRRPIIRWVKTDDLFRYPTGVREEIWIWEHSIWARRKCYWSYEGCSWATWNYDRGCWEWISYDATRRPLRVNPKAGMRIGSEYQQIDVLKGIYARSFPMRHRAHHARSRQMNTENWITYANNLRVDNENLMRIAEERRRYGGLTLQEINRGALEELERRRNNGSGGQGGSSEAGPSNTPNVPTNSGSNARKITIILTGIILVTVTLTLNLDLLTVPNLPIITVSIPTINLPAISLSTINLPAINLPAISMPTINISSIF